MIDFGKGPTLREACPWLQNDEERIRPILDVTERDSVIEGLPPFTEETRRRIAERLREMDRTLRSQAPSE